RAICRRKGSSACSRAGARRSATASTSSMLRWFSPKMMGSSVASVMGIPERVEIEPLQGCLQATSGQRIGIALDPLRHHRIAFAAAPGDALGKGHQMDAVARTMLETEQQVHRTLQQPGQQPRALGEVCWLAEKVCGGGTRAMQRHAVA